MRFVAPFLLMATAVAFMPASGPPRGGRPTTPQVAVESPEEIAKKLGPLEEGSQVEAELIDNNIVRAFRLLMEYSRQVKDQEGNDEIVPPFQDLFILLGYTGLLETLQLNNGPFTLFAPTDEAFHKFLWGEEAVEVFPEGAERAAVKDKLKQLLLYHVVSGKVTAAEVTKLSSTKTLQGGEVAIAVEGGTVKLNGEVSVIKADVEAANGVVHVVDGVLVPK